MRNRGAVVVIRNKEVALIKRNRGGKVYYVFPGGGIEEGETPKQAAQREAYEELGVHVIVGDLLTVLHANGKHYYFYAYIVSGTFGTGTGEEFNMPERGTYEPLWVPLAQLSTLDVRPKRVADMLIRKK
ncbi:NUDIX domain-containing protein [Ectobacillus sp. JY-23]|uniref:NUDIX hydrolase n=1 Tax=Ectobacillus sp. JY-23 TaxID=2933872 RepID=UPI001FF32583|nr:NUDIX domain-containing protein [Ectobacillus sp. JY-23]UOY92208.1 NUDIX domain-containing protein [Ectobacillus sp. JY-23]